MVRRIVLLVLVTGLLLAACGGGRTLDDESISDLRAANEDFLSDFTNEELREVATALCDGYAAVDAGESSDNSGDLVQTVWDLTGVTEAGASVILANFALMEAAWDLASVKKAGAGVILASIALIDAACPEVLTTELAADSEPITMRFTLVGSEGDEYEYSPLSGCKGQGGYEDVHEGMLFNLTNEQGDIVGVVRLDESEETSIGCTISGTFSVTYGELDDDTLYFVGDRAGSRGELAYTGAELREQGEIALSLG